MSNVINFPPKRAQKPRDRKKPRQHGFIFNPATPGEPLGQIDEYDDRAVVYVFTGPEGPNGKRPYRRFIVDTPIEAANLILRVSGHPDLRVIEGHDGKKAIVPVIVLPFGGGAA